MKNGLAIIENRVNLTPFIVGERANEKYVAKCTQIQDYYGGYLDEDNDPVIGGIHEQIEDHPSWTLVAKRGK